MPRSTTYEVELALTSLDDLYRAPDLSPFDPRYGPHSAQPALEFIADAIYSNGSYRAAKATFVVPEDERDLAAVTSAVRRWASARATSHQRDVAATRWRGVRGLMTGVVLFALLIALSQLVGPEGDDLLSTLAKGLDVAAWVVLWFPLETLVWSLWQFRLDRSSYAVVRDMEISLRHDREA